MYVCNLQVSVRIGLLGGQRIDRVCIALDR